MKAAFALRYGAETDDKFDGGAESHPYQFLTTWMRRRLPFRPPCSKIKSRMKAWMSSLMAVE